MGEETLEQRLLVQKLKDRPQQVRGSVQRIGFTHKVRSHLSQLSMFRMKDRQCRAFELRAFRRVEGQQHVIFKSDMAAKLVLKGLEGCNRSRDIPGQESSLMLCKQILHLSMLGENG